MTKSQKGMAIWVYNDEYMELEKIQYETRTKNMPEVIHYLIEFYYTKKQKDSTLQTYIREEVERLIQEGRLRA